MTEPCDDDPDELPPGAGGDPYCNLTVAAQRSCAVIIAAAHALYFHRHRLGGAAERETKELLAALNQLREAADFLAPTVRAADHVEVKAEPTGAVPVPGHILSEIFLTGARIFGVTRAGDRVLITKDSAVDADGYVVLTPGGPSIPAGTPAWTTHKYEET